MRSGRLVLICGLFLVWSCGSQRATTQELLDLAFVNVSGSAIELQSPGDNTSVGLNPTFVWSERSGALLYRVEVSTNKEFSQIVLDKRVKGAVYTLLNSDLIGISSLDSIAYYWRVSA